MYIILSTLVRKHANPPGPQNMYYVTALLCVYLRIAVHNQIISTTFSTRDLKLLVAYIRLNKMQPMQYIKAVAYLQSLFVSLSGQLGYTVRDFLFRGLKGHKSHRNNHDVISLLQISSC